MNVVGKNRTVAAVTSADNAAGTATLAAAGTGQKWLVKGWGASFTGAAVSTPVVCTVTIGSTVITFGVGTGAPWSVDLGVDGIESDENGQPSIQIAAGGAGAIGRAWINAYKVPASFTY